MSDRWWRVEVSDHDGQIVAIEPGMLSGRDIGVREESAIREVIENLIGFVGASSSGAAVKERK